MKAGRGIADWLTTSRSAVLGTLGLCGALSGCLLPGSQCDGDLMCSETQQCGPTGICEPRATLNARPPTCGASSDCSGGRSCHEGSCAFTPACMFAGGEWRSVDAVNETDLGSANWNQIGCQVSAAAGPWTQAFTANIGARGELGDFSVPPVAGGALPCTGVAGADETYKITCSQNTLTLHLYARPGPASERLSPVRCKVKADCAQDEDCSTNSVGVPSCARGSP